MKEGKTHFHNQLNNISSECLNGFIYSGDRGVYITQILEYSMIRIIGIIFHDKIFPEPEKI